MGNCCAAPRVQGPEEGARQQPLGGGSVQQPAGRPVPPLSLGAATAAAAPLPGGSPGGDSAPLTHRSEGWHTAVDGGWSDGEEEWHDALSEADLAEALEEWEQELQWHDPAVDEAIQVLKASGHLLPAELEAAAGRQRQEDMAAEQLEAAAGRQRQEDMTAEQLAAPRVLVAAVPAGGPKLERSQRMRAALEEPAGREALGQAAELAAHGRVLAAHAALQQLAQRAGGSVEELAALPPGAVAAALPPGASLDVGRVARDVRTVSDALRELEDHAGWMVSRSDALKVYYRHVGGTTVHSLKFSAVFDHPLEHLLALAHEFDLVVTWNKFSLASLTLAAPSIFESYLYGAQWMMRPFRPMQALLRARGFDLAEEHRCLLVDVGDCAEGELPGGHAPLPKEWPKRKLVNFMPGSCLKLRPLPPAPDGTPRTEGSLLLHLDPHIPFIPAFLLNFVLGVLSPYIFKQMRTVLNKSFADPQGVYPRRIAEQPRLYGLVRRRMAEFAGVLAAEAEAKAAAEGEEQGGRRRRRSRTTSSSA